MGRTSSFSRDPTPPGHTGSPPQTDGTRPHAGGTCLPMSSLRSAPSLDHSRLADQTRDNPNHSVRHRKSLWTRSSGMETRGPHETPQATTSVGRRRAGQAQGERVHVFLTDCQRVLRGWWGMCEVKLRRFRRGKGPHTLGGTDGERRTRPVLR